MAPTFFFMLYPMRESSHAQPVDRASPYWHPPTRQRDNRRIGPSDQSLWYFDGNTPRNYTREQYNHYFQWLQEYRTMSIYCDSDTSAFWSVSCDASQQDVGVHGSDDDDDDDGLVWRRVGFASRCEASNTAHYAVTIEEGGELERLPWQRSGYPGHLTWCHTLLPPNHHAYSHHMIPPEQVSLGGLIGQLNLIIALFAFSVRQEEVPAALQYCMHGNSWRGPNIPQNRIGRGWHRTPDSRRGLVVRILYFPSTDGSNPKDDLEEFEDGDLGKILN